jgi:hypothetical protein
VIDSNYSEKSWRASPYLSYFVVQQMLRQGPLGHRMGQARGLSLLEGSGERQALGAGCQDLRARRARQAGFIFVLY